MSDFYITLPSSVRNPQSKNTSSRYVTRLPEVLHLEQNKHVVAVTDIIYPYSYVNINRDLYYRINFNDGKISMKVQVPTSQYNNIDEVITMLNQQSRKRRHVDEKTYQPPLKIEDLSADSAKAILASLDSGKLVDLKDPEEREAQDEAAERAEKARQDLEKKKIADAKKKEEKQKADALAKAEEAKKLREQQEAEERKNVEKKAEEARKIAEQQKIEAQKKAEIEKKNVEKKAEEARKNLEKKKAEDARKAEQQRVLAEKKKAEEKNTLDPKVTQFFETLISERERYAKLFNEKVPERAAESHENYIRFEKTNGRVDLKFRDPSVKSVEFEKSCAYFLGFKDDVIPEPTVAENTIDLYGNVSTLYLYCDIVDPTIVGDEKNNLLTVIPCKGNYGEMIHHTFAAPRYVPVLNGCFDTIKIELLSEFGDPINFNWGSTVVTLHIKPQNS